jgi:hypothetical protein
MEQNEWVDEFQLYFILAELGLKLIFNNRATQSRPGKKEQRYFFMSLNSQCPLWLFL